MIYFTWWSNILIRPLVKIGIILLCVSLHYTYNCDIQVQHLVYRLLYKDLKTYQPMLLYILPLGYWTCSFMCQFLPLEHNIICLDWKTLQLSLYLCSESHKHNKSIHEVFCDTDHWKMVWAAKSDVWKSDLRQKKSDLGHCKSDFRHWKKWSAQLTSVTTKVILAT